MRKRKGINRKYAKKPLWCQEITGIMNARDLWQKIYQRKLTLGFVHTSRPPLTLSEREREAIVTILSYYYCLQILSYILKVRMF